MIFISNKHFKVDIPSLNPKTYSYKEFWEQQLKRVREGYWVSGKWMPGRLYYYTNFHKIQLNKTRLSTQKTFDYPTLRDIEWEVFYLFEEARGFSGFDNDDTYTCLEDVQYAQLDELEEIRKIHPYIYNEEKHFFKTYIPARTYLRMNHEYNKGIPMYFNEAKNFLWMTGRGLGKSYTISGLIAHEWLFDGKNPIHKYTPEEDILSYKSMKTSVILGAGDSKKTGGTMKKIKDAIRLLPGTYETVDMKYPAPFYKKYTGNFETEVIASYKKKLGSFWEKSAGSQSKISALSLGDNPFLGQGDRNNLIVLEEIGHFKNPIKSYHALVHNMILDSTRKFGTMMMVGTGGDMEGGSTADAQYMFYNPENFNLLTFNDEWENKGKIAYFMPSWMNLNYLRNEEGIIDKEKAIKALNEDLENCKKTKDRSAYEKEVTYKARVPSEVFLMADGNIFPIVELREHLFELEKNNVFEKLEKPVELYYDQNGLNGIAYKLLDKGSAMPINMYPWPDGHSKDGSPVIYEFPIQDEQGKVPNDLYVIGHDPFRTNAEEGSLAATIVMKTSKYAHLYGYNEIVAVYYGRPFEGRDASNEILLKLALFYNAKVMFENNVGNVKDFFEKRKRLDLLYKRPSTILNNKDNQKITTASFDYGYPLSNLKIKMEALQYLKTFLLEERGRENIKRQIINYDRNGKKKVIEYIETESIKEDEFKQVRNLNKIWDKRLLQELIAYSLEGNFDAVHGFVGCILALEENANKTRKSLFNEEEDVHNFNFILNNKRLFPNAQRNQNISLFKDLI